jgi:hypothetical protein
MVPNGYSGRRESGRDGFNDSSASHKTACRSSLLLSVLVKIFDRFSKPKSSSTDSSFGRLARKQQYDCDDEDDESYIVIDTAGDYTCDKDMLDHDNK